MRSFRRLLFPAVLVFSPSLDGVGAQSVAEIVTFRLIDGSDPAAFVKAARGVAPALDDFGGMMGRVLSRDEDGLWTDHLIWASDAQAKAAAAKIMTLPEGQAMMRFIDPSSVTMRHADILFEQDAP